MGTEHHTIMEVKSFVDNAGREVKEFIQVFGKDKDKVSFYKGRAMVKIQGVGQNGIPMPPHMVPFEFCFPEDTTGLKKAFDTFDEVAKKEIDEHAAKMREQAKADRVVAAGAMPTLLGANGKPVGG
jgi:hypothetical protein